MNEHQMSQMLWRGPIKDAPQHKSTACKMPHTTTSQCLGLFHVRLAPKHWEENSNRPAVAKFKNFKHIQHQEPPHFLICQEDTLRLVDNYLKPRLLFLLCFSLKEKSALISQGQCFQLKPNSQWNRSLITLQKSGFEVADADIIAVSVQRKENPWSLVEKVGKPRAWRQGATQEVKSTVLSLS